MMRSNELLVSEANTEGVPRAEIKIHYQLFDCTDIANHTLPSDSATFINSIEVNRTNRLVAFPIPIAAVQGRKYMLFVQITDLLRRNVIRQYISIDKTNIHSAQNFRVNTLAGNPKLENYVNTNDIIRIEYLRGHADKLFIKYMDISQPIATSPLSIAATDGLTFRADSIWEHTYNPTTNYLFGYEGLYLIQVDTTRRDGLLLMNFGIDFPSESRTTELLQPIQYLLNEAEFERLSEGKMAKNAMDDFWFSATRSTDRARMLIRVFYTRMMYANQYFTDFKEGWKTDRGMIFMVYGLPNKVQKGSHSETWIYTRQSADPLRFIFEKKESNYSVDFFVLRRSDASPTFWRQAVESWRRGQIFNINDLD
jgi:GWxTD domain-containing protein